MKTPTSSSKIPYDFLADSKFINLGDIIRICMTDRVSRSINEIVIGTDCPSEYAAGIIKNDSDKLISILYHNGLASHEEANAKYQALIKRRPEFKLLFEAYSYDQILMSCFLFRISAVREVSDPDLLLPLTEDNNLFATALINLLNITEDQVSQSYYSGLAAFENIVEFYIHSFQYTSDKMEIHFLRRFGKAVGTILKDSWIFYDKNWCKALFDDDERLHVFRKFLFLSIIASASVTDEALQNIYFTEYKDLESDMCEFIELREATDTTYSDIVNFINRIENHSLNNVHLMLYYTVYHRPFNEFETHYKDVYLAEKVQQKPMMLNPYEKFIEIIENSLGECWAPGVIIQENITPIEFVSFLMDEYKDTLIEKIMPGIYAMMGISLPPKFDKEDPLFLGSIKDFLYLVSAYIRYENIEKNTGFKNTSEKTHILLTLPDDTLGLSMIPGTLYNHLEANKKWISESEVAILGKLMNSLNNIYLSIPVLMSDPWKEILNHTETRGYIRIFMISVMESIYLRSDKDYASYLQCTRKEWFETIERFTTVVNEKASIEDFEAFFMKAPVITESLFMTDVDEMVWSGSFMIPQN